MSNTMSTFTYLLNLEKSIDPFIENKIKKYEEKKKRKMAKTDIDIEIFRDGLYELGLTHDKYNHAFLSLNISARSLISIGGIHKFIYLQNVNVSNNNLTSLDQLSGLKHLVKLYASHNKIITMFDFDPPQNLEYCDYSFNHIKDIVNVSKNKFLKCLHLSHNSISKIENLSENIYLEELNLSFNSIGVIENLDNLFIMKLNLMDNKIRNITGLENLPNLLELNLSKNSISRLKGLQNLQNLRYLCLSSNSISRAKQVAYISELPYLTDVDFCYNDVQTRKFYRYQILYYLSQLRTLDGQEISFYEKVNAEILFDNDKEKRKEIFFKYLPDEEFVDRRMFVKEQIDPESDSEEDMEENLESGKAKQKSDRLINTRTFSVSSINEKKTKDDHLYSNSTINNLAEAKIQAQTYS